MSPTLSVRIQCRCDARISGSVGPRWRDLHARMREHLESDHDLAGVDSYRGAWGTWSSQCDRGQAVGPRALTPRQVDAMIALSMFVADHDRTPSLSELGAALGLRSLATTHALVEALAARGQVTTDGDGSRWSLRMAGPYPCPGCGADPASREPPRSDHVVDCPRCDTEIRGPGAADGDWQRFRSRLAAHLAAHGVADPERSAEDLYGEHGRHEETTLPPLAPRQHDALTAIDERMRNGHLAPTYQELADLLGLTSTASSHRLVMDLADLGYLEVARDGASRSIRLLQPPPCGACGGGRNQTPNAPWFKA